MTNLVGAFHDIADHYYEGCRDWNLVEAALKNYEEIKTVLENEQYELDAIHRIRNITGIQCQD